MSQATASIQPPPFENQAIPARRPRVLISAYACHPESSMESRLAWRRAVLAADRHDVTVICGPAFSADELARFADEQGLADRLRFYSIGHDRCGGLLVGTRCLYYAGYSRWQRRVLALAKRLHAETPFDLVHQVNYCGYREPGVAWRLGVPYVWGPVGGTQSFPVRFVRYAGILGGARELFRNALNFYQLRYSRRVGRAAKAASTIISATSRCQQDLLRARGIRTERELETGLDCPIGPPRAARDSTQTFRVLAAGRLEPWKGLPLLIQAVAALPTRVPIRVRVLGDGSQRDAWKRLAERKLVADRFEFVPWPSYRDTLTHYRWADALAFTSLRDTSGTGLLESLASGAPIIGLDHQGAADVMTDKCAIRVPVDSPRRVVDAFADAITRLSDDPALWLRLSRGAQQRAGDFDWDSRAERTNELYARVIREGAAATQTATSSSARGVSAPLGGMARSGARVNGSSSLPQRYGQTL